YADGVLRLTIPMAEEAKPRKISVAHTDRGLEAGADGTVEGDKPETATAGRRRRWSAGQRPDHLRGPNGSARRPSWRRALSLPVGVARCGAAEKAWGRILLPSSLGRWTRPQAFLRCSRPTGW